MERKRLFCYDVVNYVVVDRVSSREDKLEKPSLYWSLMSYVSYVFLVVTGYLREFFWGIGPIDTPYGREYNRDGYPPLYSSFEGFYTRNIFRRYKPVVGQPIKSVPGSRVRLNDRVSDDYYWTSRLLDTETECINLGSYNYLGYAECSGPCTEAAVQAVRTEGVSACSSRYRHRSNQVFFSGGWPKNMHFVTRLELGKLPCHVELEKTVAEFLGVEDSIACGMGFATNSLNIPRLLSKVITVN